MAFDMPTKTTMLIAMKMPAVSLCVGMLFGFCETAFTRTSVSSRAMSDLQNIGMALHLYAGDTGGWLPKSINVLAAPDYEIEPLGKSQ